MVMNATDLREAIGALNITQAELARLVDVTPRAISLWLAGEREIAGPVASYLRLLLSLPSALQAKELAKLKSEDPKMYEGMYGVIFQGATGTGIAALVLSRGLIFGSDGAVKYDGTYKPSERTGYADLNLHLLVPPGVPLVQGVPAQPMVYGFDLNCSIAARGNTQLNIQTPFGQVQAAINFLRDIPI